MHVRGYQGEPRPQQEVAIVTVPVDLEVFEVSSVPVRSPSVNRGEYTLEVPPGRQEVLLQYLASWEGGSTSDVVRSRSMSLMADFRAGGRYRIEFPALDSRRDAERFAEEPSATLIGVDGQRVEAEVRLGQQGLFGRAPGNFRGIPPGAAPAAAPSAAAGQGEALEQLKHWWNQAGEQERAAFLQWMVR